MSLARRVTRLEAGVPTGCTTCREWPVTQVVVDDRNPKTSEFHGDPWTAAGGQCPTCGRVPVRQIVLLRSEDGDADLRG